MTGPRKDQLVANAHFELVAEVIRDLPPAADERWWTMANLTWREYLAIEFAEKLEATAERDGVTFSRRRFFKACAPESGGFDTALLSRRGHAMTMGIWMPDGADPYARPASKASMMNVMFGGSI